MAPKTKFYTDEHVAKAVVKGLRQRGVDVLTVLEAGMLGASSYGLSHILTLRLFVALMTRRQRLVAG